MGYDPNRIDASLSDCITSSHDRYDWDYEPDWWLGPDWDYDYDDREDELDRDAYYHGIDLDADEEYDEEPDPEPDDPHEIVLPFMGKVSPVACMGGRIQRPTCPCCGLAMGVRRGNRRPDRKRQKRSHRLHLIGDKHQ